MTEAETFLADLPGIIAEQITAILPDLEECAGIFGPFDLKRLRGSGHRAPAVLPSLLKAEQGRAMGAGVVEFRLGMAAYIMTKDRRGLDRDDAAYAIGRALLLRVPEARWNRPELGAAQGVKLVPLITRNTENVSASLLALTWTQPAVLKAVPVSAPVPITLYAQTGNETITMEAEA